MVICLERGANDMHMVHLIPVPPHHLFTPVTSRMVCLAGAGLHRLSWKKRPLNGCGVVVVSVFEILASSSVMPLLRNKCYNN